MGLDSVIGGPPTACRFARLRDLDVLGWTVALGQQATSSRKPNSNLAIVGVHVRGVMKAGLAQGEQEPADTGMRRATPLLAIGLALMLSPRAHARVPADEDSGGGTDSLTWSISAQRVRP